jgi:hypothetical protein
MSPPWDTQPLPLLPRQEAERLRDALPHHSVAVTFRRGKVRYEVVAKDSDAYPWCVISDDPAEIISALHSAPQAPG